MGIKSDGEPIKRETRGRQRLFERDEGRETKAAGVASCTRRWCMRRAANLARGLRRVAKAVPGLGGLERAAPGGPVEADLRPARRHLQHGARRQLRFQLLVSRHELGRFLGPLADPAEGEGAGGWQWLLRGRHRKHQGLVCLRGRLHARALTDAACASRRRRSERGRCSWSRRRAPSSWGLSPGRPPPFS